MLDDKQDVEASSTNATSATFALSRDLGTIQATQDPIIWVVGHTTDPAINYTDLSGASQLRSLCYMTKYVDMVLPDALVSVHIHQ